MSQSGCCNQIPYIIFKGPQKIAHRIKSFYKRDGDVTLDPHQCPHCEHQPNMPGPSELRAQHKRFDNLFALVIGIDNYKNANGEDLCNLRGAVADANAVNNFLRNRLMVPDRNVRNLQNEEATRNNIINAIRSFGSNINIKKNDPILIYYAGHGSTSKANMHISNDETPLRSQEFEIIVPFNINLASDRVPASGVYITGIADYEIRHLLNEIAKKKGNNITMFLDCCHSASLNRGDNESGIIRQMSNPAPLSDVSILDLSRDGGFVPESAGLDSESHVLLAACGRGERAREKKGHGAFTMATLDLLSKYPIQTFSYRFTLDKANFESGSTIDGQTPHCVGVFDNRRMFELEILNPRPRGVIRSKEEYIIPLGTIHGMCEGVAVNIYTHSEGEEKALGRMEILGPVGLKSSLLKFGTHSKFKVPNPFFVEVIGSLTEFRCFCADIELRSALKNEIARRCPGLKISDNAEGDSDVTVIRERRKVIIRRTVVNRSHGIPPLTFRDYFNCEVVIGDTTSSSNLELLCCILSSAARFYHHLTRRAPEDSNVKVELLQLERDPDGCCVPLRGGNVIIRKRSASINLMPAAFPGESQFSRPIGMRLRNNNSFGLQSYVFYFNPRNLKIAKWQSPSFVRSFQEPDIELPGNSFLEIGFNNSNTGSFEFYFPEGLNVEIGYFKIFVARRSCPHLEDIVQDPFSDSGFRDGVTRSALTSEMARWWGTEVIEVVQRGI